jgi:hypothetical protein
MVVDPNDGRSRSRDDEKAIEAKTKNAWAHFECWYDGSPFERDPKTGKPTKQWLKYVPGEDK